MAASNCQIAFLGYGRMAQAISEGLDRSGRMPYRRQAVSARRPERLAVKAQEFGLKLFTNNEELLGASRAVVVAVKPYQVAEVLAPLRPHVKKHLFISVAAGLNLAALAELLPPGTEVIRAMPNTPALVGEGVTAICPGPGVSPASLALAREIFEAVGFCAQVEERLFGAVSALSGCGPAYVSTFMEALTDGGVLLGLDRELASELAARTTFGAARLALSSGRNFAELRAMVTSPGGLTAEATQVLERGAFRGLLVEAMRAAARKDRELAGKK